jgi:hypothetical protein
MALEFFIIFFNIQFHKNPSSGYGVKYANGLTDSYDILCTSCNERTKN